ncbi:hypothetical protein [Rhizobium miluonense]|uniref:Uncharacterized protein n=1 Tax=Rhizobium miluonense TaxID=411945 RepID=A0A1C3WTV7_9HYPH|nr:hypothetical protein [Rhizobium miluonense]SCB43380.1 hypothetical protein GA0061102_104010 [Rhizobium miluonense]
MRNHAVAAAGGAVPVGNILASLRDMLKSGDVGGALSLLDTEPESHQAESPLSKLYAAWQSAFNNWVNSVSRDEDLPEGPLHDACEEAFAALLSCQCHSAEEVQLKLAYFSLDRDLRDWDVYYSAALINTLRIDAAKIKHPERRVSPSGNIPILYDEWLAVRNRDIAPQTEEEAEAGYEKYADLQSRIIAAEPQTPSDVAIQFLVDTDDADSSYSKIFLERIRQISQSATPLANRNLMSTQHLNLTEAMGRLGDLLNEAAAIVRDNPELKIDRIAVNEHGVHTFIKNAALAPQSYLTEAIASYKKAQRAWWTLCRVSDDTDDSREWHAYEAAADDVLYHPCRNLDEVREKARFITSNDNAFDSLRNCYLPDGTAVLVQFLRSLLGNPVDNGPITSS